MSRKKTRKKGGGGKSATSGPGPRRLNVARLGKRILLTLLIVSVPVILISLDLRSKQAHADLSVIGNGKPVIVQIHDPACPTCRRLQRNTRSALSDFQDTIEYRIADITTGEGASFARRHGVPHVTLLLFDGAGELSRVIEGVRPVEELQAAFAALQRPRSFSSSNR